MRGGSVIGAGKNEENAARLCLCIAMLCIYSQHRRRLVLHLKSMGTWALISCSTLSIYLVYLFNLYRVFNRGLYIKINFVLLKNLTLCILFDIFSFPFSCLVAIEKVKLFVILWIDAHTRNDIKLRIVLRACFPPTTRSFTALVNYSRIVFSNRQTSTQCLISLHAADSSIINRLFNKSFLYGLFINQ